VSSRQVFALYGLVLAFVFVSFLLGLLVGRGSGEQPSVVPALPAYERMEDLETQLDFYDELSKPSDEGSNALKARDIEEILPEKAEPLPALETEVVVDTPSTTGGTVKYTIQVAAHSTEDEAQQMLIRLRANNFGGRIQRPDVTRGDDYYRVWIGEFASTEEARSLVTELKAQGFHTYIRKID
jgi:cell division septation protein DedD